MTQDTETPPVALQQLMDDAVDTPLWVDSSGALYVTIVSQGGTPVRIVNEREGWQVPQRDPGPWLVIVLLLGWVFVCWRLRAYGEVRGRR